VTTAEEAAQSKWSSSRALGQQAIGPEWLTFTWLLVNMHVLSCNNMHTGQCTVCVWQNGTQVENVRLQ